MLSFSRQFRSSAPSQQIRSSQKCSSSAFFGHTNIVQATSNADANLDSNPQTVDVFPLTGGNIIAPQYSLQPDIVKGGPASLATVEAVDAAGAGDAGGEFLSSATLAALEADGSIAATGRMAANYAGPAPSSAETTSNTSNETFPLNVTRLSTFSLLEAAQLRAATALKHPTAAGTASPSSREFVAIDSEARLIFFKERVLAHGEIVEDRRIYANEPQQVQISLLKNSAGEHFWSPTVEEELADIENRKFRKDGLSTQTGYIVCLRSNTASAHVGFSEPGA